MKEFLKLKEGETKINIQKANLPILKPIISKDSFSSSIQDSKYALKNNNFIPERENNQKNYSSSSNGGGNKSKLSNSDNTKNKSRNYSSFDYNKNERRNNYNNNNN